MIVDRGGLHPAAAVRLAGRGQAGEEHIGRAVPFGDGNLSHVGINGDPLGGVRGARSPP